MDFNSKIWFLFWYQNELKLKPCRKNTSPLHTTLVFKTRVDITHCSSNVLPSLTNSSGNFSSISYAAYMYKTTALTSSPVDKSFSKSSNSIQWISLKLFKYCVIVSYNGILLRIFSLEDTWMCLKGYFLLCLLFWWNQFFVINASNQPYQS